MVTKDYSKTKGSGKAEVGEIDTSAPFQSVKDAVSLFGEGAFSGERPAIKKEKSHSADRVLAKETELHLAESKLNKLKDQLESAEASKAEALLELALSKQAVVDLTQKLKAIQLFKNEIEDSKGKDIDSIQAVLLELGSAKGTLRKAIKEENSLRSLMEILKVELDEIKKENSGLKERELETESNAGKGNLQVKLRKVKSDLEIVIEEEAKERSATDETISTLRQMVTENRESKRESENMRIEAAKLKREAEAARIKLEEVEEKLKSAVIEAEEAKAAEARALNRIRKLKQKSEEAENEAWVVISRDEFESLGRKAEERERLAEMKVAAAVAQVEAMRARENEAVKKLESCRKEIEEMKGGAREALRRAEVAEAARKAVEGELRRWREREEKVACQRKKSFEEKMKEAPSGKHEKGRVGMTVGKMKEVVTCKQEKGRSTSVGKMKETAATSKQEKGKATTSSVGKKSPLPSLSALFKKGSGEWNPSYLPGETRSFG